MATKSQLVKSASNQKELSSIQKRILLATIFTDKKKILINPFDNIPIVKLYTADLKQENFIYSKIKGSLCFLIEKENAKSNYFLQIYDKNNFSLVFSVPINQKMTKDVMKLEENFLCLPTKFHFLGFKFNSKESMTKFLKIFTCEGTPDKASFDTNLKARDFKCTYKEILKIIKDIKPDFEKKYKAIDSIKGNVEKEKDKNIFQRFYELHYLVNCIEYDEENKIFNVFIDKTFNPNIIKSYIDIYKKSKNKKSLNIRIIFDDYTHIYDKDIYVDLLVNNMMNNISEEKRLIIFKREHKKRHDKEDFEESKRINSEYYMSKAAPSSNNDKFRNSANIQKTQGNNNLKRNNGLRSNSTFNNVNSIKEVPEESVDHLKNFNEKEKKAKK